MCHDIPATSVQRSRCHQCVKMVSTRCQQRVDKVSAHLNKLDGRMVSGLGFKSTVHWRTGSSASPGCINRLTTRCQQAVDKVSTEGHQGVNWLSSRCRRAGWPKFRFNKVSTRCQQSVNKLSTSCQQRSANNSPKFGRCRPMSVNKCPNSANSVGIGPNWSDSANVGRFVWAELGSKGNLLDIICSATVRQVRRSSRSPGNFR